jgi:hypothetical protein
MGRDLDPSNKIPNALLIVDTKTVKYVSHHFCKIYCLTHEQFQCLPLERVTDIAYALQQ